MDSKPDSDVDIREMGHLKRHPSSRSPRYSPHYRNHDFLLDLIFLTILKCCNYAVSLHPANIRSVLSGTAVVNEPAGLSLMGPRQLETFQK